MSKKYQKWVMVGVGLVIVIGGGWWYLIKGKEISKQWNQLLPGGKQREEVLKRQPSGNQTPIDKMVLADQSGAIYVLKVKLAEPWSEQKTGDYQLLRGGVTLINDPLGRIIPIQIGMLDGTVYVGEYPEGWGGEGTYNIKPQGELERLVELGDEMRLQYKLPKLEKGEDISIQLATTKILDGLASEYRSGEYQLEIPTEFLINTEKVGIITK